MEVVALGAEAAPDAEAWSSLSLPLDGVEAGTWLLGVEDRFGNLSTQEVTIP